MAIISQPQGLHANRSQNLIKRLWFCNSFPMFGISLTQIEAENAPEKRAAKMSKRHNIPERRDARKDTDHFARGLILECGDRAKL
jgi:hypothetical protein